MRLLLLAVLTGSLLASSPVLQTVSGGEVRPFQPQGPAGLVFFVCTDCPISNGYAPEIQRICSVYKAKGVSCTLLYEDLDLSPETARKHLAEYGYTGAVAAIDAKRTAAKHAKAAVTPTAVVVDRQGAIRYRGRIDNFYAALGKPRQQVTEHNLTGALDDVLAGRAVPVAETKALGCYIIDPEQIRK